MLTAKVFCHKGTKAQRLWNFALMCIFNALYSWYPPFLRVFVS